MSKYTPLWEFLQQEEGPAKRLTYDEIQGVLGIPLDHSFLRYKKELPEYGWQVKKISMKERTVLFERLPEKGGPRS